ncbi:MAG: tetratricopeptide repeat protein [Burkholderiales bacterium]
MHRYGVRDVEKLLKLPRSTIRALVGAGFVSPARGPRKAWLFSFRDLVVLRTAQALAAANVSPRRINTSVKQLRRRLPDAMPLSGLSICAVGDRVVVREGTKRWQAESGQYLLAFEGDPADGSLSVIDPSSTSTELAAAEWFEKALELESSDAARAMEAYERAIAGDPGLIDAHVNLGRLLHEAGRIGQAERVYRQGLLVDPSDAVLLYNLGVLLEDTNRKREAAGAYEVALRRDPEFADCHYNLALLCEALARPRDAIRHMAHYRRITARAR